MNYHQQEKTKLLSRILELEGNDQKLIEVCVELEAQRNREQDLKSELTRLNDIIRQQNDANNQSHFIESQIQQKLELHSQRNIELEEERRQFINKLQEKDIHIEKLEENRQLQDQLLKESREKIYSQQQELNLTGQIRLDLEQKIKDIADELILIKQRNEAWVNDSAQERNQMELEIEALHQQVKEKDNLLQEEIRNYQDKRRSDQQALVIAQKECSQFQQVANATQEENLQQEQEVKTCHQEIVYLKNQLNEQKEKNRNLFSQVQQEKEIQSNLHNQLNKKEANLQLLEGEKKQLANQITEKEKILQNLESEYVNATSEIQQKRKAINNLQDQISSLESQSNQNQSNNEIRVNKLLNDYMTGNERTKQLEQAEQNLKQELQKIQKQKDKSEQEKIAMADELSQMKKHISEVHDYVQNFIEVKCKQINEYHTKINKLSILEDIKKMIKDYKTTSIRPSQREQFSTLPANFSTNPQNNNRAVTSFKKSVYGSIMK